MKKVEATITGDFVDDLDDRIDKLAERLAKVYYDTLLFNIRTNRFRYPQSDRSIITKAHKNRNLFPMIDSGAYLRQIRLEGTKVFVADGTHPESGFDFIELANILEYGRKDLTFMGYPVWRDTLNELEPFFETMIEKFLLKYMVAPDKKVK